MKDITNIGDYLSLNVSKIKKDFPILKRKINGNKFIYLDSASTSQKPIQVINSIKNFYEKNNSNVHRSIYKTSEESTKMFELTRFKIKKFLDAEDYEIIFTKNCTEAINLVVNGWVKKNIPKGKILSSVMEHHSNIVPWFSLKNPIKFLDVNNYGELNFNIDNNIKMVSLTHVSNVLGTINNVKEISEKCYENGSYFMLDGAQSTPHMKISLKKINCDFFTFSGHKMLSPTGVGVLAVKKELTEKMNPILFGSDMIKEVNLENFTVADSPYKFEAGTPNIESVIGLSSAIDYLEKIGMRNIEKHTKKITKYAFEQLQKIKNIKIYGPKKRIGLISFNLKNIHSHDVASIINEYGIAIRSGHHCAQPLMKRFNVSSMSRASFYLYNDEYDVDSLINSLNKVYGVFKL